MRKKIKTYQKRSNGCTTQSHAKYNLASRIVGMYKIMHTGDRLTSANNLIGREEMLGHVSVCSNSLSLSVRRVYKYMHMYTGTS